MAITTGALLGAAGLSALGGIGGSAMSQALQYNYQKKLQQQQQKWQERMSNTAHQREKADLLAAGINPLYTATGGNGASTPSGGMGQAGLTDMGGNVQKGIASAFEFQQLKNQTSLTDAEVGLKNAQTDSETTKAILNQAETAEKIAKTILINKESSWYDKIKAQEILESTSRAKLNYGTATAQAINAEANQSFAKIAQEQSAIEREYKRKHPIQSDWQYGIGQWTGAIGNIFKGSGNIGKSVITKN